MAGQWFVLYKNGTQQGPMTPAAVKNLVLMGQLKTDDKVRPEEKSEWQIAGTVHGLFTPPPPSVQSISTPPQAVPLNSPQFGGAVEGGFANVVYQQQYVQKSVSFFDFGFTKFLTPKLIPFLWRIVVFFACLFMVIVLISGIDGLFFQSGGIIRVISWFASSAEVNPAGIQLMITLVGIAISGIFCAIILIVVRVCSESAIALLKIAEHLPRDIQIK